MTDDDRPWSFVKIDLSMVDYDADRKARCSRMVHIGDFTDPQYIQQLKWHFDDILREFRIERHP